MPPSQFHSTGFNYSVFYAPIISSKIYSRQPSETSPAALLPVIRRVKKKLTNYRINTTDYVSNSSRSQIGIPCYSYDQKFFFCRVAIHYEPIKVCIIKHKWK